MKKRKVRLILRGFLYKENWTPLSTRKQRNSNYTINFLKCYDGYQKLVNKLKSKYKLSLYFTTYNITPKNIINSVDKLFDPDSFFFTEEIGSSQFSTTRTALSELEYIEGCMNILLRADMTITDLFIDEIMNFNFDQKDSLYVLCKEINKNKEDKVIDTLQIFYDNKIRDDFLKEIKKLPKDLHKIHKKIHTKLILKNNATCINTELCKDYFRIYPQ